MTSQKVVRIPEVELTLDQLVRAIRQLDPAARSEIAKALLETERDARMTALIQNLDRMEPAEDIADTDIAAEVKTVRVELINEKIVLEPIRAKSPIDALYGLYHGHDFLGDLEAEHALEFRGRRGVTDEAAGCISEGDSVDDDFTAGGIALIRELAL